MRLTVLVVAGALALGVVGCGGSSPQKEPAAPAASAEGQLKEVPEPLTMKVVAEQPDGSAARAVLQLWLYAQWGSTPNVFAAYSERVQLAVGQELANAYAQQRDTLVRTSVRILDSQRTERGTLVTLQVRSPDSPPGLESFLLEDSRAGWRVIHDTYLERALNAYGTTAAQDRINPAAKTVSARASRAGRQLAETYRTLYLKDSDDTVGAPSTAAG